MQLTETTFTKVTSLIDDLFYNVKLPKTKEGILVWLDELKGYDVERIIKAVKSVHRENRFFVFSELLERLDSTSRPMLPDTADVVAIINKLATNSRQDISGQPEHIQETIRLAGGLVHIGQREPGEWLNKHLEKAYEDYKQKTVSLERQLRITGDTKRIE